MMDPLLVWLLVTASFALGFLLNTLLRMGRT